MKTLNPKRLNINEIWKLYRLLGDKVSKDFLKSNLLDEAQSILDKINDTVFLESIKIMYGDTHKSNPLELALLFIRGLKEVGFFAFVDFVRKNFHDPSDKPNS